MSYTAPNIPANKHLFFDRHGGVSVGKYASLNCSIKSEDARENILQNFALTAEHYHLPAENLAIIRQGITNHAVFISEAEQYQQFADGLVTATPNIILAIRTADCCPVLFYDNRHQVIGAAHAGWRSALYGILENTLNLMLEHGAEKETIAAALGPCLQRRSFECRADMLEEFLRRDLSYQQFFTAGKDDNHFQFDLEAFVAKRLQTFGLSNISTSAIDTYSNENYFSFRRNTHRRLLNSQYDYPTHLSTITL